MGSVADAAYSPFSMQNAQKCLCGAAKCRGILGPRPPKDRKNGEQEKVDTKRATGVKQMKNGVIAQKVEKKVKTASTRSRR